MLDIGCDDRYLKSLLPPDRKYLGIDIAGSPDVKIDLEKNQIPSKEKEFDTVICLDVLEHLDNLYEVFGSLVKASRKNIIISLPNCWGGFKSSFLKTKSPKFYGLPENKPTDRHKWFFNTDDAVNFFEKMANRYNLKIDQLTLLTHESSFEAKLIALILKIFPKRFYYNFFVNSVWVVFTKN